MKSTSTFTPAPTHRASEQLSDIPQELDAAHRPDLLTLFAPYGPRQATEPLTDFSRLLSSAGSFCEVQPETPEQVAGLVMLAQVHNVPLRIRGNGHALNGSSLPLADELAVHTRRLLWVRYEQQGTVTAGAGVGLWALRAMLNADNLTLPVVNDGYAGPSVGGFISAGGFGLGSADYGGFWENVTEVLLATAQGLQRIKSTEPLFPWLFGSMGQLGLVVEATLKVIPHREAQPHKYQVGRSMEAEDIAKASVNTLAPTGESETRLYWFTLFAPESRLQAALGHLTELERRHAGVFQQRERYRYFIRSQGRLTAPLVYPDSGSFFAIGSWGFHEDGTATGLERLRSFERDFMQVALTQNFRRYVQSEHVFGVEMYQQYFGSVLLSELRTLKASWDPQFLFNRGSVFSYRDTA